QSRRKRRFYGRIECGGRCMSVRFRVVYGMILMAGAALAQAPAPAPAKPKPAPPPSGPAPRLPSGRVDLTGTWRPADIFLIEDISLGLKKGETVPVNDWSKQVMSKRLSKEDPEANCLPTGVPRHAPYPWRIVEVPGHVFFLFEGNIH